MQKWREQLTVDKENRQREERRNELLRQQQAKEEEEKKKKKDNKTENLDFKFTISNQHVCETKIKRK